MRLRVITVLLGPAVGPMSALPQSVRDSADVSIVENARAALPAARTWRIDGTPILVAGGATADGDTLGELQLIMGVAQLGDGRFAVGVQGSSVVRFYDARGRVTGSAGRKGEGPGEFRQVMGVRVIRGDTLVVTDLGELEVFSADGKFVRQGPSRVRNGRFVYPAIVFTDGSYLGRLFDDDRATPAGRSRRSTPLVRVSADGARVDTIGSLLGPEEEFDGRTPYGRSIAFSTGESLGADGNRYFIGSATRFEILEFAYPSKLTRRIRMPERANRVTGEAIQAYRTWFENMPGEDGRPMSPAMKARFAQMLEGTVYAERFPPWGALMVDKAGYLWAQHFDYHSVMLTPGPVRTQTMPVPSRWDVFDRSGAWLCTIDLPARFTPVEIGVDYVAGVGRDEDEVEQVRVYRLRKP